MFVDFDGTISDGDTFDVLTRHYAGEDAWAATERGIVDGSLTLRDVLARQAAYVTVPFEEAAALLDREIRIDPTFAPFVARHRALGDDITILSSGIEPIIRRRMAEIGLGDIPIVANGVDADPAGWRLQFIDAVSANATDKARRVREASAAGSETIFIGDGRSDFDAALAADRRFAKRGLALDRYLAERKIPFTAFASFDDVALARRASSAR